MRTGVCIGFNSPFDSSYRGEYMKVLQKIDLPVILEQLAARYGKIYGPMRRHGGELRFGQYLGEELDLDGGLPMNSPKDIFSSRLAWIEAALKEGRSEFPEPVVLFGIRPCDLDALDRLQQRLIPQLGENVLLGEMVSLIVANTCSFPELNCFHASMGGDPKQAPKADILFSSIGNDLYIHAQSQRGTKALEQIDNWLREADDSENQQLHAVSKLGFQTFRKPDIPRLRQQLHERIGKLALSAEFEDCLACGNCLQVCPMYLPIADTLTKTKVSTTKPTYQRLPFENMLMALQDAGQRIDCVGCGRCSNVCPSGLGMLEAIDNVLGRVRRGDTSSSFASSKLPEWLLPIRQKLVTPVKAFSVIRPGDTVFLASGCAEPQFLARAFMENYHKFLNVQVIHLLSMGAVTFDDPQLTDHLRLNAFFIGDQSRQAVASGQADYTPVFLSELPELFRSGQIPVDVALIQVSPPDRHGYCTLGISVETIQATVASAHTVIAQINQHMPRTYGDTAIHIDDIDEVIHVDEPLIEWRPPAIRERTAKIGQYIAQLVEDGATLQIGIGKIGQALLPFLRERKNLGIHTQIITDEVINLMQKGVVNNRLKGINEGRTVASFAVGTRRCYAALDNNPSIEFRGMDYVSDPNVISKNNKMTAINSAFEVDLAGQVCADSMHHQFYSGIASMASFLRGAARSKDGKPIIALPSTALNGEHSRIQPLLSPGNPVVATRGDVHYIITEYGIAYLHGKSLRERALALIEIAHPKFRGWLLEQAKQLKYIFEDQELPSLSQHVYPEEWETTVFTTTGEELSVRPIKASDEPALQRLYYSLSDQDVFMRFMGNDRHFHHNRMQALTVVNYDTRMAIVATRGRMGREEIMGIARYDIDPASGIAEVAFTIRDSMRRQGIGTRLLEHLTVIAKSKGVKGFRAEILSRNRAMMSLFNTSGARPHSHVEDGMYTMWYAFDSESDTIQEPTPTK